MNKGCTSLVDVVRIRASQTPSKSSCLFLIKEHEEQMTYADLDEISRAIAARLQAQGLKKGDRVLLLFAPGLAFIQAFFGCLYAGCIAVPIHPPAQEKLWEKASQIITNAKPSLALMSMNHFMKFSSLIAPIPCLAMEQIDLTRSNDWDPLPLKPHDIAFLQYTSGSTMHPKGVILNHHNLLDNMEKIYKTYAVNEESLIFSWLPPHHDMGLIGCILTPIYAGIPTVMMSPFSFLQNPLSWLQNISKYKASISGAPNFAYDYCVKRIKEERKQGLDLSSWRIASNGAEPIRKETLEHFYQAFKHYGFKKEAFFPCYGLAEATLLVTGSVPGKGYQSLTLAKKPYQEHRVHFLEENNPESHTLVSCGRLVQEVVIVDPETLLPCASDHIGEIWVKSPSVAQGYWEQKEETNYAFHAHIQNDLLKQNYLRTGDLGFIHQEELYVTGRIKDLIILYGKNHYPQDIEHSILHSPLQTQLGKCAAFVLQADHHYQLVILCEVKNCYMEHDEQETLFRDLLELVYQVHQLEIHRIVLIPLKAIPHTTSGKIRRHFCRKSLMENSLQIVAHWIKE